LLRVTHLPQHQLAVGSYRPSRSRCTVWCAAGWWSSGTRRRC